MRTVIPNLQRRKRTRLDVLTLVEETARAAELQAILAREKAARKKPGAIETRPVERPRPVLDPRRLTPPARYNPGDKDANRPWREAEHVQELPSIGPEDQAHAASCSVTHAPIGKGNRATTLRVIGLFQHAVKAGTPLHSESRVVKAESEPEYLTPRGTDIDWVRVMSAAPKRKPTILPELPVACAAIDAEQAKHHRALLAQVEAQADVTREIFARRYGPSVTRAWRALLPVTT